MTEGSIRTQLPTKALLVGCGGMGSQCHLPVLLASPSATLVGIVRPSGRDAGVGIRVLTSLEQALEDCTPDLVIISTPHRCHYEQALISLRNHCHVYVEKPLALHYREAQQLVDLADEKGKLLVVGLQRRYEGFATVFRKLVGEGRLGEIRLVHGLFAHRFGGGQQGWRGDPALAGAGIVDDSAIHLIDLLLYFAGGRVRDLEARMTTERSGAMPHSLVSFFDTDSGASVSACATYLSPANSVQEEISLWGTRGAVFARRFCREWNNTEPPTVFFKSSDGREKQDFDLSQLPMGRQLPLKTMLGVLSGEVSRDALVTEARSTLEAHRVIELIRDSSPAV